MSTETEVPTEDVVSKYKRLLTLARSSLEANQTSLAAKDKYISQLQKALDDEKALKHNKIGRTGGKDEESMIPRNILRRVDVEEMIWILIEYDGNEDSWTCFGSAQELADFIQCIPGVPLIVPHKCFSPSESARIESESRKCVEKIVEEFRRYKVRTEIARKSKDAETKMSVQRNSMSVLNANAPLSLPLSPSESQQSLNSSQDLSPFNSGLDSVNSSELQRLKSQLSELELKWRKAYEKVVKENELLRTRGGEAMLAVQWRERYEMCLRERDSLSDKLKMMDTGHLDRVAQSDLEDTGSRRGVTGYTGDLTVEQAYEDLKAEYKEFRLRVRAAEEKRQKEKQSRSTRSNPSDTSTSGTEDGRYTANNRGGEGGGNGVSEGKNEGSETYTDGGAMGMNVSMGLGMRGMGLGESKIQYVRHMVFQYLTCKDAIVKPHIESALVALFRYNEAERLAIDDQRKMETEDTITSITNYLGLFTT